MIALVYLWVSFSMFHAVQSEDPPEPWQLQFQLFNYLETDVYLDHFGGKCIDYKQFGHRINISKLAGSKVLMTNEQNCMNQISAGRDDAYERRFSFSILPYDTHRFKHLRFHLEYLSLFWWFPLKEHYDRRTCVAESTAKPFFYDHTQVRSSVINCGDVILKGKKTIVVAILFAHQAGEPYPLLASSVFKNPVVEPRRIVIHVTNRRNQYIGLYKTGVQQCWDAGDIGKGSVFRIEHGQSKEITMYSTTCGGPHAYLYFYINEQRGGDRFLWSIARVRIDIDDQVTYRQRRCSITSGQTQEKNKDTIFFDAGVEYCSYQGQSITHDKYWIIVHE